MRKLLITILMLMFATTCWGAASRNFRGSNNDDIIDFGSDTSIDGYTQFTIATWIRHESFPSENTSRIGGKFSSFNTQGEAVNCNGASGNCFYFFAVFSGDDGSWGTTSNSLVANSWQFVLSSYDGSSTSNDPDIYVDCSLETESEILTPTGTLDSDAASTYRIGNNANPGIREFDGQIAYSHYYNQLFDAVECSEIMWKPGLITVSLGLFAPLWGDSTEIDLSGNGNTGTVTGATTSSDGPPVMFGSGLPL